MDGLEGVRQSEDGHARGKCRVLVLTVLAGLVPVAVSLFLALNAAHAQGSLLANGGFEAGTAGWSQSFGATFLTVTTPVSAGTWAASLTKSGVTGDIWISYTLTGWVYKNDSAFQKVCLRIEWHGTGGVDEVQYCLSQDAGYYRPITVGPTLAPPDTSKARIKLLADIRTADPPSPVYFDDIRLTSNLMPRGYLPLGLKNYPG
jgi:hypothetical protein